MLIAAEYLGISLLTSRTTRFHGLSRVVADHFGRRTVGAYLGPDRGGELASGGRGDRLPSKITNCQPELQRETAGCKERVIFALWMYVYTDVGSL